MEKLKQKKLTGLGEELKEIQNKIKNVEDNFPSFIPKIYYSFDADFLYDLRACEFCSAVYNSNGEDYSDGCENFDDDIAFLYDCEDYINEVCYECVNYLMPKIIKKAKKELYGE